MAAAAVLLVAAPALGGRSPVVPPAGAVPGFTICPCVPDLNSTSLTGWFSLDLNGAYTTVNATWVQPSLHGSCPTTGTTGEVLFGIGFASLAHNATVGQRIGTGIACGQGRLTYFGWYQFAPHPAVRFSVAVHPGDRIAVNASSPWPTGGRVFLTLVDRTSGAVRSVARNVSTSNHGVAWFIERPPASVAPAALPDFGSVVYRNCWTDYLGTPNSIGSTQNDTAYTMLDRARTAEIANISAAPSATSLGFVWR